MQMRPYKLFGDAERAAALAAAQERIHAWERAWLPAHAEVAVECAPARELRQRFAAFQAARWTRLDAGEGQWLLAHATEADLHALALCACAQAHPAPDPARSELAAEAAAAAWRELGAALLGAAPSEPRRGAPAGPDEECWLPGSASLAIRAAVAGARFDFVSSAAWALRLLGARRAPRLPARLESRRQAIASRAVELRVLAGSVELDLRAFRALEVGNVIALDTRIDQPMAVVLAAGAQPAFCAAHLGALQGRKAAALASQEGQP